MKNTKTKQTVPFAQVPNELIYSNMPDGLKILIFYCYSNQPNFRYNIPNCTQLLRSDKRKTQRYFKTLVDAGIFVPTKSQKVRFGSIPNYLFKSECVLKYLKTLIMTEIDGLESDLEPEAEPEVPTQPTTKVATLNNPEGNSNQCLPSDLNDRVATDPTTKVATEVATDPTTKVATEVATDPTTEVATKFHTNNTNKQESITNIKKQDQETKMINNKEKLSGKEWSEFFSDDSSPCSGKESPAESIINEVEKKIESIGIGGFDEIRETLLKQASDYNSRPDSIGQPIVPDKKEMGLKSW